MFAVGLLNKIERYPITRGSPLLNWVFSCFLSALTIIENLPITNHYQKPKRSDISDKVKIWTGVRRESKRSGSPGNLRGITRGRWQGHQTPIWCAFKSQSDDKKRWWLMQIRLPCADARKYLHEISKKCRVFFRSGIQELLDSEHSITQRLSQVEVSHGKKQARRQVTPNNQVANTRKTDQIFIGRDFLGKDIHTARAWCL